MKKPIIDSVNQIPQTMTELEARDFWDSHSVGTGLLKKPVDSDLKAQLQTARNERKSRNITLNISTQLEQRLRHVASIKHTPYQSLLKEFVIERLYEEEKRLGVLR
jgi:CopG antitoxin of type II toxin-antitoxin system